MAVTITIKGKSPQDEAKKHAAFSWLAKNATTEEVEKIVQLAKNPLKRAMLKSF